MLNESIISNVSLCWIRFELQETDMQAIRRTLWFVAITTLCGCSESTSPRTVVTSPIQNAPLIDVIPVVAGPRPSKIGDARFVKIHDFHLSGSSTNEVRGLEMVDSGRVDPCVWRYTRVLRPYGIRQVSPGQRPWFPR